MLLARKQIIEELKSGGIYHSGCPDHKEDEKGFREFVKLYVQPASIDFPIGSNVWAIKQDVHDPRSQVQFVSREKFRIRTTDNAEDYFHLVSLADNRDGKLLLPGQQVLAHSEHVIGIGTNLAAQVATRSTAKRWGLDVCGSAGWVDPGYRSKITLEIKNDSVCDLYLREGVCYAQIIFFRTEVNQFAYTGHYNKEEWTPQCMLPKPL